MMGVLRQARERRMALQEKSGARRALVAQSAVAIASRVAILDRAVAFARSAAARPLVIGSLVAVVVLVGPRRIFRWAMRGVLAYGTARRLAAAIEGSAGGSPAGRGD